MTTLPPSDSLSRTIYDALHALAARILVELERIDVKRDWRTARAWLKARLNGAEERA